MRFWCARCVAGLQQLALAAGLAWLGLLAAGSALAVEPARELRGTVVAVVDGDTLVVQDAQGTHHTLGLAGIDAPEKMQVFGRKAKFSLSDLTYLKAVRVELGVPDARGRHPARVWVDQQDVALAQLARGMAWVDPDSALDDEIQAGYRAAQAAAQRQKAGLWSQPQPVAPWVWRSQPKLLH